MTFRKILCLLAFAVTAYALNVLAGHTPLPPILQAGATAAAAIWLLVELSGASRDTPRPSAYPPNRGFSRQDYAAWRQLPVVRSEHRRYAAFHTALWAAFALIAVAIAFVAWQTLSPVVPAGVSVLAVLALATAMVFFTNAYRYLRPVGRTA